MDESRLGTVRIDANCGTINDPDPFAGRNIYSSTTCSKLKASRDAEMVRSVLAMARNSRQTRGRPPASRQVILKGMLDTGYVLAGKCFAKQ